jgi:hypothetical protein
LLGVTAANGATRARPGYGTSRVQTLDKRGVMAREGIGLRRAKAINVSVLNALYTPLSDGKYSKVEPTKDDLEAWSKLPSYTFTTGAEQSYTVHYDAKAKKAYYEGFSPNPKWRRYFVIYNVKTQKPGPRLFRDL